MITACGALGILATFRWPGSKASARSFRCSVARRRSRCSGSALAGCGGHPASIPRTGEDRGRAGVHRMKIPLSYIFRTSDREAPRSSGSGWRSCVVLPGADARWGLRRRSSHGSYEKGPAAPAAQRNPSAYAPGHRPQTLPEVRRGEGRAPSSRRKPSCSSDPEARRTKPRTCRARDAGHGHPAAPALNVVDGACSARARGGRRGRAISEGSTDRHGELRFAGRVTIVGPSDGRRAASTPVWGDVRCCRLPARLFVVLARLAGRTSSSLQRPMGRPAPILEVKQERSTTRPVKSLSTSSATWRGALRHLLDRSMMRHDPPCTRPWPTTGRDRDRCAAGFRRSAHPGGVLVESLLLALGAGSGSCSLVPSSIHITR